VFLPSGDALLTRRVHAVSSKHAVVVRWSPARNRNERQGLLVERDALERTAKELERQNLRSGPQYDEPEDDAIPF
jgi:hypothetical protein